MNLHSPIIDQTLDDLYFKKIEHQEAMQVLLNAGVSNPTTVIDDYDAAIQAIEIYAIRQQVQQVHAQYVPQQREESGMAPLVSMDLARPNALSWVRRVAAIFILVTASWFSYQYATVSDQSVYEELFQPYSVRTDRGAQPEPSNPMINDFKDQNFALVLEKYRALSSPSNRDRFLASQAALQLGSVEQAANLLTQILELNKKSDTRLYQDEAEYYLALAYLKMGKKKEAYQLLSQIRADSYHTFHERVNGWTLFKMRWLL